MITTIITSKLLLQVLKLLPLSLLASRRWDEEKQEEDCDEPQGDDEEDVPRVEADLLTQEGTHPRRLGLLLRVCMRRIQFEIKVIDFWSHEGLKSIFTQLHDRLTKW